MKTWFMGIALSVAVLAIVGCANFGASDRVITVGMATNYAPLAYQKEGDLVGAEVDFAQALGEQLDASIKIKTYAWDELLSALNADEIDVVMSGVSITEKRETMVRFTDPYMDIGQMAVIRAEDAAYLASVDKLKSGHFRIGYSLNTTGEAYVKSALGGAKHKGYATNQEGVEALINKEIDYFIHDAPTVWQLTSSFPTDERLLGLYTPLTREYLAWAVHKDNAALQKELNEVVKEWSENGFISRTLNKWIPVSVEVVVP